MSETDPQRPEGEQPGAPEPARLRRGVLGYRRSDVDRTLATRDAQGLYAKVGFTQLVYPERHMERLPPGYYKPT